MNTDIQIAAEDLPFADMIRARTNAWKDAYDAHNRRRVADMVTMTQRKRGDYFGYYHSARVNASWRSFTGKGMVTYPVIERSVKSKTATSVSTQIRLAIEPVRNLPEKEAGAEICKSIYKFVDTHLWDNKLESSVSEYGQLGRFCFLFNNYSAKGGLKIETPTTEERNIKSGTTEYVCNNCGMDFAPEDLGIEDAADMMMEKHSPMNPAQSVMMPEADEMRQSAQTPGGETMRQMSVSPEPTDLMPMPNRLPGHLQSPACPDCGAPMTLTNMATFEKIMALTGAYTQNETGFPEMKIISPLQIRIDAFNTLGFDYKSAHWFNFHPLIPVYQLLKIAPHLKENFQTGNWSKWSESARWHYDLAMDSDISGSRAGRGADYALDELVEVDFWWITPQACHGWTSPEQYEHDGFTIKAGESIEDACVRQFGSFEGCLVMCVGDEVIPIGNQSFTESWVGVPWRVDAQSFFPQGEENLLKPQDAITNIISMVNAHVGRFGNPKLVVNALRFGNSSSFKKNFAGQIIFTNSSDPDNADTDWRKDIGYLQPGDISAAIYQFIQMIISIAKETSGVFDETVGNVAETSETLGGRKMALTQSLTLLTPTQQAKALAKIEWAYVMLKLIQKYAPDEAFALYKGTFEEEWKHEDIAAFRDLNIEQEVFIQVVQGTDLPKTQLEMEERFLQAMNFGLFTEPNPMPVEIRNHVVKNVLGIDYDIANYSATKRIADRRYAVIKDELAMFNAADAVTVAPDAQGFPVRSLRPEIIASIMQDARTAIRETDDHLAMIGYWTDQLNSQIGSKEQNEVLIFAVEQQIRTHRAFTAAAQAQAMAAQSVAEGTGEQIAQTQNMGNAMMAAQGVETR